MIAVWLTDGSLSQHLADSIALLASSYMHPCKTSDCASLDLTRRQLQMNAVLAHHVLLVLRHLCMQGSQGEILPRCSWRQHCCCPQHNAGSTLYYIIAVTAPFKGCLADKPEPATPQHTHGIHMAYTWHTHGIHMAYTWHTHGVHMAYTWHAPGIHMACTWHTHGIHMACTCKYK